MGVTNRPLNHHLAFGIANRETWRLPVCCLFADVEGAICIHDDVVGSPHAGPHALKFSIGREDLNASVDPVADIDFPVWPSHDTVRQVELAGCIPRLTP